MIDEKANEGKVVDREWHEFRDTARRVAYSPEEFSETEQVRYNLENDDRVAPGQITGATNPDNYNGSESTDIDPLPLVRTDDDPIR